jgi:5'-deoxynucleotidase YfbR-like HD superfamily hydrolase
MIEKAAGASAQVTGEDLIALVSELAVPLADVRRTLVLPTDPERQENVSEHSFTLALVACSVADALRHRSLDVGLVAQYAIVHDLVEVYAGDTSVWASEYDLESKPHREQAALAEISRRFDEVFPWIALTIERYELRADPEARFVYALDKVLPHVSILVADRHPIRPARRDYLLRVEVARKKIGDDREVSELFDDLLARFDQRSDFFADVKTTDR